MVAEQDQTARLGVVEGRIAEQSVALQEIRTDLREGLKEVNARVDQLRTDLREGLKEVNARVDHVSGRLDHLSSRIDRMFVSSWAIGGGIIASLIVLIIRGT